MDGLDRYAMRPKSWRSQGHKWNMAEPRSDRAKTARKKRAWPRKPTVMRPKDALGSPDAFDDEMSGDWRFGMFFLFLRVSATYLAADKLSRPSFRGDAGPLPSDFASVQRVFASLGSVHGRPFRYWWHHSGRYCFGFAEPPEIDILALLPLHQEPDEADLDRIASGVRTWIADWRQGLGTPATALLAVPLSPDRRAMLRALNETLIEVYARLDQPGAVAAYQPMRNRIQARTVIVAYTALCFRVAYPDDPLWRIALRVEAKTAKKEFARKMAAQWIATDRKPKDINADDYGSEASRFLDRAYRLAENAARGRFPSLDDLPGDLAPKGWWKFLDGPLSREVEALRAGRPLPIWGRLDMEKLSSP